MTSISALQLMAQTSALQQAINEACKQPTLREAFAHIAVWESERIVQQAHKFYETGVSTASPGQGWDTMFDFLFKKVEEEFLKKQQEMSPAYESDLSG